MIEKLKSINTLQDLHALGTVQEIICIIDQLISPIKISVSSYEELLPIIVLLKNKWVDLLDTPFTSKREEYLFYLTSLEGKQRNTLIGLTNELYTDKTLAKKWYKSIVKIIQPDVNTDDRTSLAFKTLKSLYDVVIED